MKNLIFVNGTMGAGKTTLCRELKKLLAPSVFLDGDWCWDMEPFSVTDETRRMVMDNIQTLLNRFLQCSQPENILFGWVMQDAAIVEQLLSGLKSDAASFRLFTLTLTEDALRQRLQQDVDAGLREPDVVERSVARLPLYARPSMKSTFLDVTDLSPKEAARQLVSLLDGGPDLLFTSRLTIRPMTGSETEALMEGCRLSDPELSQAYREMLEGGQRFPDQRLWYWPWRISLRSTGALIGDACFKGLPANGRPEIGYGLERRFRGCGFATEAVAALCQWALSQPGVQAVEAETEPANAASQRVLQKNGFLPMGVLGAEGPRFALEKRPCFSLNAKEDTQ